MTVPARGAAELQQRALPPRPAAAPIAWSAARADGQAGLGRAQLRFRLLHLAQRRDAFRGQAALALEGLARQLDPGLRLGDTRRDALPSSRLWSSARTCPRFTCCPAVTGTRTARAATGEPTSAYASSGTTSSAGHGSGFRARPRLDPGGRDVEVAQHGRIDADQVRGLRRAVLVVVFAAGLPRCGGSSGGARVRTRRLSPRASERQHHGGGQRHHSLHLDPPARESSSALAWASSRRLSSHSRRASMPSRRKQEQLGQADLAHFVAPACQGLVVGQAVRVGGQLGRGRQAEAVNGECRLELVPERPLPGLDLRAQPVGASLARRPKLLATIEHGQGDAQSRPEHPVTLVPLVADPRRQVRPGHAVSELDLRLRFPKLCFEASYLGPLVDRRQQLGRVVRARLRQVSGQRQGLARRHVEQHAQLAVSRRLGRLGRLHARLARAPGRWPRR